MIALTVAGSLVLQASVPGAREWIDLYLIVSVYYAISRSRTRGILMGASAGFAEDIFSSNFLGFHAFVKTGVTYLVGGMGARFMLNQPVPQVLALLMATLADGALAGLLAYMSGLPVHLEPSGLFRRAVANSVVGLAIYRSVQRRGVRRMARFS